jgi:hypothetical protein
MAKLPQDRAGRFVGAKMTRNLFSLELATGERDFYNQQ